MANNLLNNPIIITTAMASSYKTSTLTSIGSFQYLRITKLYWESPGTIGDTVNIEDASGNTIANMRCEVADQSQVLDWTARPLRVRDFQVNQISSGTLYIYID